MKKFNVNHTSEIGTDTWLTPPELIKSLGDFDLDPCTPLNMPWPTAKNHYTIKDDGLKSPWFGRVWLNPPYGRELIKWMEKMSLHLNGVSLIFARTDTKAFQDYIFPFASSILFIKGRLTFLDIKGNPGISNGGAASVLIAYGEDNVQAIHESGIDGKHVFLQSQPILLVGFSSTWKSVVKVAFTKLNATAALSDIYKMVSIVAPDKVIKNRHFEAKVRQTLQLHFERAEKGRYVNPNKQQKLIF